MATTIHTVKHGSLVWASIAEDAKLKVRPCVVMTASAHMMEVYWGRGTKTGQHVVTVRPASSLGRKLGLTKETHFCALAHIYLAMIDRVVDGMCDALTLLDMEQKVEKLRLE